MKVFDAFNRVMSGRRKQRDDRPFPPDLLRDEHTYLNNFAGSRSVVYAPMTEKIFDPIQNSPQSNNDTSKHYQYQTHHAGNPYIVHSGKSTNQSFDQGFIPFYNGGEQHTQKNQPMAFTLPSSLSQSTSDYGSSKSNKSRRRHGSFSDSASPKPIHPVSDESPHGTTNNGFHQRSRSSSGGYRHIKMPINGLKSQQYTMYHSSSKSTTMRVVEYSTMNSEYNSQFGRSDNDEERNASSLESTSGNVEKMNKNNCIRNINEPIYSEPLPPMCSQVKEAEVHRTNAKYFPDPNDPVQISNHIYEYLVKKSKPNEISRISHQPPLPPLPHDKRRRNSLSSITNSTEDSNSNSSNSVERRQQNSQINLENQKRNLLPDSNDDDYNKQEEWSFKSKIDEKKPQEDCKKVSSSTTFKQQDNNDCTTKTNNNTTTSLKKETLSHQDATSANEAVNLQNRLRTLSSGLVGLRNCIHDQQHNNGASTMDVAVNIADNGLNRIPEPGQPNSSLNPEAMSFANPANDGGVILNGNGEIMSSASIPPPMPTCLSNTLTSSTTGFHENGINHGTQQQPHSHQFIHEGFNTLRSVKSHVTEVSSVMTANVSDPSSNGGNQSTQHPISVTSSVPAPVVASTPSSTTAACQLSPPQPVNTLQQHNYSNIQQPAAVLPSVLHQQLPPNSQRPSGPNSLPSNNSPAAGSGSPFAGATTTTFSGSVSNGDIGGGVGNGAFSRSAVRPRTPTNNQGERLRRRERVAADEARKNKLAELRDLIHLEGELSEDSVVRALQTRFFNQKYFTNVGPIVLSVNPYRDVGNPLTLTSTREATIGCPELGRVVQEAVRMQGESGYPQAIIVSGASGSGKTFASMAILRKLFEISGGGSCAAGSNGHETDTFKHLAAAFTVLRSLCTAKTATNRESSRVGHFIEVQVSDGALYRTKIHCYFLDQCRVVSPLPMEKNYHIFYQMLAGLSQEERSQLGLEGYTVRDLLFLNMGDTRQDEVADAQRFVDWKANLAVLGIPFMDVVRVFASILLLGNVEFEPNGGSEEAYDVEIIGKEELNSVAALLGVSASSLLHGLTSRTHLARGVPVKSMSDANLCNATRNALAKALYCRTVATIVRRANSLKRPVGPLSGTMSSDSNESVHHEVASHHASTVGTSGSRKSSKSMAILNNAVRHATDGFIGILDMFGFEDSKPSQLEHLCINLCSETMQHFYNTHIFKSSIESCREEGISTNDAVIEYVDNVPCIDLISSLRTGLLSMLDVECSVRGFPDTYVQKVKVQHKDNRKLFEPKHCDLNRTFGIHHYAGQVVYDTSDFLDTNRDVIADDLVSIFARENCQFGFATHLFGNEIKALHATNVASGFVGSPPCPRGASFRISPTSTSHPDHQLLNGDEPVSTLTQDFHTRLDNLLRTLVHAKPHFVRCIRPNEHESLTEFDRMHVTQQVRSLQILETVNLMAYGFPHRMRFKAFNSRYRMLAKPAKSLSRLEEKAVDDCEIILDCYSRALREEQHDQGSLLHQGSTESMTSNNKDWAHGRKHIFLSEGARQQLEQMRDSRRKWAATKVQSLWRGWNVRKKKDSKPKRNDDIHNSNQFNPLKASTKTTISAMMHHSNEINHASQMIQNKNMMSSSTGAINGLPLIPGGIQQFQNSQLVRSQRPRPQPISGTPPPESSINNHPVDRCDFKTIQQTCSLFGLDLERPPPVPPSRHYTVSGNKKIAFPQTRVMNQPYSEEGTSDVSLMKGETVIVIGNSPRRGYLVVEKRNHTIHVPYNFLALK